MKISRILDIAHTRAISQPINDVPVAEDVDPLADMQPTADAPRHASFSLPRHAGRRAGDPVVFSPPVPHGGGVSLAVPFFSSPLVRRPSAPTTTPGSAPGSAGDDDSHNQGDNVVTSPSFITPPKVLGSAHPPATHPLPSATTTFSAPYRSASFSATTTRPASLLTHGSSFALSSALSIARASGLSSSGILSPCPPASALITNPSMLPSLAASGLGSPSTPLPSIPSTPPDTPAISINSSAVPLRQFDGGGDAALCTPPKSRVRAAQTLRQSALGIHYLIAGIPGEVRGT